MYERTKLCTSAATQPPPAQLRPSTPNLPTHIPLPTITLLRPRIRTSTLIRRTPNPTPISSLLSTPLHPLRHPTHPSRLRDRLPIPDILCRLLAPSGSLFFAGVGLRGVGRRVRFRGGLAELAGGSLVGVGEVEVAFVSEGWGVRELGGDGSNGVD